MLAEVYAYTLRGLRRMTRAGGYVTGAKHAFWFKCGATALNNRLARLEKAGLATLNKPLKWWESTQEHGGKYAVLWDWDGETLTTESKSLFSGTWGRVDVESVIIRAKPKDGATVVVQSNDWVNKDTVFRS